MVSNTASSFFRRGGVVLKRAQVGQHVGSCHAVLAQSHEVFLRSFPLPGFLEVGEMVLGPSVRS